MFNSALQNAKRFLSDESGPTAVEYAIMLALIVGVIIGTVLTTGQLQNQLWIDSADRMNQAISGGSP